MIKPRLLFSIPFFLILLLCPYAYGRYVTIDVKEFKCQEGRYCLKFGMINKFTYSRKPTIAFKISDGEKILTCDRVSLKVPSGADGSVVHEVSFDVECSELRTINYQIMIFEQRLRNRVNLWLSDCPR